LQHVFIISNITELSLIRNLSKEVILVQWRRQDTEVAQAQEFHTADSNA